MPVGRPRGRFGWRAMGWSSWLRSGANGVCARASHVGSGQRVLRRPLFESGRGHRARRGREGFRRGHSVLRGPNGRGRQSIHGRRSDCWRAVHCARGYAGRYDGGGCAGGRLAPPSPWENRLFFCPRFIGSEDEDQEAQEERREHGKDFLATRKDPWGRVALRGIGIQKPGHFLSSQCQQLVTATSLHDRSPWREEHTQ